MSRMPLVVLCACVVVAHPMRAQAAPDSIAASFRPGEWGVGFVQGYYPTEAGVLRFSTPTLAWVFDGSATYDREVIPSAGVFGADQSGKSYSVNALVGPRWYHTTSAHIVRSLGFGVSGSYSRNEYVGNAERTEGWSAGMYGEIGVQYMFTRHLALGWRANLLASRVHEQATVQIGSNTVRETIFYHVFFQPVQVTANIYF